MGAVGSKGCLYRTFLVVRGVGAPLAGTNTQTQWPYTAVLCQPGQGPTAMTDNPVVGYVVLAQPMDNGFGVALDQQSLKGVIGLQ